MLGIRLHQGVQIDLHQGDLDAFMADGLVVPCDQGLNPLGRVAETVRLKSKISTSLPDALPEGIPFGEALLAEAGLLPTSHVIYAVIPSRTDASNVDQKTLENALKAAYLASFRTFAKTQKRHLAVSPLFLEEGSLSCRQTAPIALSALRLFLDAQEFGKMRRISFVLSGAEDYQTFRKAMFSTFPEADQE